MVELKRVYARLRRAMAKAGISRTKPGSALRSDPGYGRQNCTTPPFTTTVSSTVIVVRITGRSKWPAV